MWKKWLAFSGVLALIILLDPTHTEAQPGGGGKGGKGGFGQPREPREPGGKGGFGQPPGGGGFGQPPGGGYGQPPGGGGTYVIQPSGGQPGGFTMQPQPGGGGFGRSREGGGFGQPQPGGGGFGQPPGGGGGFTRGGGSSDPEQGWVRLQRLTSSSGDTVDLSKIPPETRPYLKTMAERTGALELPASGVWSKNEYLRYHAENEAAKASFAARNPGGSGGPPGMGSDPRMMMEGRGRDRGMGGYGMGEGGYGYSSYGGYGGYGGYGMGEGGYGRQPFERKETEEERPVAMRYGKLPQGLPGWYNDLDTDTDGQISLYEWRKGSKEMKEFKEMDLNSDCLVTADEYLRFARQKGIDTKVEAYLASDGAERPANWGLGAPLDKGDVKTKGPGGPPGPGSGMWGPRPPEAPKSDRPSEKSDRPREDRPREKGNNPWSKKN